MKVEKTIERERRRREMESMEKVGRKLREAKGSE